MKADPSSPPVTVVMPVFDGERYLAEALDSALAQEGVELEVIVVDDGSTDRSADIARGYGGAVRYHFQPHAGLSAAENAGVALARGTYVSFLDCDDLWAPHKTARQLEALGADPALDMVFGHVRQFVSPELVGRDGSPALPANALMPGYSTGTMLARRSVFDRVGPFSSDFRVGEFVDWYARATDAGLHSAMLPDTLLYRRIHEHNMGVRERDKQADYLRALKASLDRRRLKPGRGEPQP